MKTLKLPFEKLPHSKIPQTCTHIWSPVEIGLWKRTGRTFPGLPACTFNHLLNLNVSELRELAREMGLSSVTRLDNRKALVLAISKASTGVTPRSTTPASPAPSTSQ